VIAKSRCSDMFQHPEHVTHLGEASVDDGLLQVQVAGQREYAKQHFFSEELFIDSVRV
jgi:hypothetical protein